MAPALVCPSCGEAFGEAERFCPDCGIPLVRADAEAAERERPSRLRQRVRKVKPQYSEGELVRVARAGNQAEAELIQGLLLEEGIPSLTKRSGGFDVPDFLAAGPRDVLVPQSGADAARELLAPRPSGGGDAGEV
ncbi:MAG TPA: DUF2007 domain-containing protein [Conexibacter sp.]|nr:DUF2007 domain-containing protein [Conexibacter sp.]